MLGYIKWSDGRRRLEGETVLGLATLTLSLPRRCGRGGLRRGAQALAKRGVRRVLTQPDFPHWPLLKRWGLAGVDTRALRCALAPLWVQASLAARGVPAERATLRLTGERESADMEALARRLCSCVRRLVIDTPGPARLAAGLRWEYGLPLLPPSAQGDLTLSFQDGPVLDGAVFSLAGAALPPCETLPLLAALWEGGRVRLEDIQVQIIPPDGSAPSFSRPDPQCPPPPGGGWASS